MSESYKFIGVLNLFNIYPDFLFPIYEKGNELFFHNGKKNRIYNFDKIPESVLERIVYLDCPDVLIYNESDKEYFFVHDTPVYTFQININEIFCSDLGNMIRYLSLFNTEDTILKKQIENFISENILEYYINVLCSKFPKTTFFQHNEKIDWHSVIESNFYDSQNAFVKNQLNSNILQNILTFAEKNKELIYEILPEEESHRRRIGNYRTLGTLLQNRLNSLSKYDRIYEVSHEMVHMDYNTCRLQNIFTVSADFVRLKAEFDAIIKSISYSTPFYDVLIKCQNSVINKDENELILLINKNHQLFCTLRETGILDDYLFEYVKNHIYVYMFEFL